MDVLSQAQGFQASEIIDVVEHLLQIAVEELVLENNGDLKIAFLMISGGVLDLLSQEAEDFRIRSVRAAGSFFHRHDFPGSAPQSDASNSLNLHRRMERAGNSLTQRIKRIREASVVSQ
jgi:hypothetical protein